MKVKSTKRLNKGVKLSNVGNEMNGEKIRITPRDKMEELFHELKLKVLEDWLKVPRYKITKEHKLKVILQEKYQGNYGEMLKSIYPNYNWEFGRREMQSAHSYFKLQENRRRFMDELFKNLNLKTMKDWLKVPRHYLQKSGGKSMLLYHYQNDMQSLLSSIYPNYCWEQKNKVINEIKESSNERRRNIEREKRKWKFSKLEDQRSYMEMRYYELKLRSLGEWRLISRNTFIHHDNDGKKLLKRYANDMKRLLTTIYPNYDDWNEDDNEVEKRNNKEYYKEKENQRRCLEEIFKRYELKTMSEWTMVKKADILQCEGAVKLLKQFENSPKRMIQTIYANYPFEDVYRNIKKQKIQRYIQRYDITEKRDWYRISNLHYNIRFLLKELYPLERWSKETLKNRNKKTKQRLLFIMIKRFYHQHWVMEGYKHPTIMNQTFQLEFDIFIPSYNLAVEYQGQQHYDDIPQFFNFQQAYQHLDEKKLTFSNDQSIVIIYVPYWWDTSKMSLQPILNNHLKMYY